MPFYEQDPVEIQSRVGKSDLSPETAEFLVQRISRGVFRVRGGRSLPQVVELRLFRRQVDSVILLVCTNRYT